MVLFGSFLSSLEIDGRSRENKAMKSIKAGGGFRPRIKAPNSYQLFYDGLRGMGFKNYDEYLASDTWKAFREWYRTSRMPQLCVVCRSSNVVLHHWKYERVGQEELTDVMPLCDEHHSKLHGYLSENDVPLYDIKTQFVECFGFHPRSAHFILQPFFHGPKLPREKKPPKKKAKARKFSPDVKYATCSLCGKSRMQMNLDNFGLCYPCKKKKKPSIFLG